MVKSHHLGNAPAIELLGGFRSSDSIVGSNHIQQSHFEDEYVANVLVYCVLILGF